ncbi:MAG TPA: tRNA (N(6)-L-threonylcarbamoyladenosine(37)-C(2))-methylthiotransferase MtaB [Candidatus Acidoferrales bacterium]|nr:tRNA (N(6)-L-threonylcarbamoyladenosine(37)-C(2))-methylthiotransferase MtaB [Candidatus Acidoferrales bacterium]
MPTFHIEQFGCRATQADAAAIERQLHESGYSPSRSPAEAAVIVVNTCTVTSSADLQARQAIHLLHRRNPAARIAVTGCYAQRAPEEVAALEGVSWVLGNSHQAELPALLRASVPFTDAGPSPSSPVAGFFPLASLGAEDLSLAHGPAKILTSDIFEQRTLSNSSGASLLAAEDAHTRPILKIQDGCDHRCAYCVIPFVRGRSRSLPPEAVLREIHRLCASGTNEVVLSGINLGSYGRDLVPRVEFSDLLRRILDETPLRRLRISSIEPMDITRDLVRLFASTDHIAHHFHLPLQSGSDRILAAMHRWYRAEHYAARVDVLREHLPDAAIGADVIAGFPGETPADHSATLSFIERLPLAYLHVFSFSKRPGTAAARLTGEVSPAILKQRARELRALGEAKSAAFRDSQIGRRVSALTLRHAPRNSSTAWTPAISGNYLRVHVDGHRPPNQMLEILLHPANGPYLSGRICAPEPAGTHRA